MLTVSQARSVLRYSDTRHTVLHETAKQVLRAVKLESELPKLPKVTSDSTAIKHYLHTGRVLEGFRW